MANHKKRVAQLDKALKAIGYHYEINKRHGKIRDTKGNFVCTFSLSPSDGNAAKRTIRDLVKYGHIDRNHPAIRDLRL